MATNTYVELAKITPSGSLTSIVLDNIPSTYTDLVLVGRYTKTTPNSVRLWVNNDTSSTLYSQTILYGNGSTINSGTERSGSAWYLMNWLSASTSSVHTTITHIQDYASTNKNKVMLERGGSAGVGSTALVSTWRSNAAITRLDVGSGAGTFSAGTTFTLYGVKAATVPQTSAKASGGYVSSDANYWYHAFPFSSTFTPTQSISADILVVAGGGGGGNANGGGGGGAGGVLGLTSQSLSATGYTVTIGAGGAVSTDGVSSSFASSVALKGAKGADSSSVATGGSGTYGSGGGVGRDASNASYLTGGVGTSGQGNNGGSVPNGGNGGGGGGGAGGAGNNAPADDSEGKFAPGCDGGIGTNVYASWLGATGYGVSGYIAGGGGGAGYQTWRNPVGGLGGGGRGTQATTGTLGATPGFTNTGSGGGGGGTGAFKSNGMPGGSGLVIVRYAK